ncbi:MAG: hypothetical protein FJY37_06575 [Betaproteobacteria bacterium]|nr:hypothetical protein [Betaproteobacteria bacterium]
MGKAAVSQEEIQLRKRARRRLVGAAFMVLVMVIVLPLLLDAEPRPQAESVRVEMPTAKEEPAKAPEVPIKPRAQTPPALDNVGTVSEQATVIPAVESKPAAEPAPMPAPAAQPEIATPELTEVAPTKPDAAAATAEIKPPVVIQLGAYLKPENAQELKGALAAARIKVFTEPVKMGALTKTRVRAGPFESEAEAEKMRARIVKMNLKLGMEPKIVARGQ